MQSVNIFNVFLQVIVTFYNVNIRRVLSVYISTVFFFSIRVWNLNLNLNLSFSGCTFFQKLFHLILPCIKTFPHQAKANAKAKFFFDVCSLFFFISADCSLIFFAFAFACCEQAFTLNNSNLKSTRSIKFFQKFAAEITEI